MPNGARFFLRTGSTRLDSTRHVDMRAVPRVPCGPNAIKVSVSVSVQLDRTERYQVVDLCAIPMVPREPSAVKCAACVQFQVFHVNQCSQVVCRSMW